MQRFNSSPPLNQSLFKVTFIFIIRAQNTCIRSLYNVFLSNSTVDKTITLHPMLYFAEGNLLVFFILCSDR
ncbi:hypothetical protein CW304_26355 [Bacillus sp. UFRGS-B20]|nr:hypothetical protein CW304_26355 [Bacillus sp. UFRGS-B20]